MSEIKKPLNAIASHNANSKPFKDLSFNEQIEKINQCENLEKLAAIYNDFTTPNKTNAPAGRFWQASKSKLDSKIIARLQEKAQEFLLTNTINQIDFIDAITSPTINNQGLNDTQTYIKKLMHHRLASFNGDSPWLLKLKKHKRAKLEEVGKALANNFNKYQIEKIEPDNKVLGEGAFNTVKAATITFNNGKTVRCVERESKEAESYKREGVVTEVYYSNNAILREGLIKRFHVKPAASANKSYKQIKTEYVELASGGSLTKPAINYTELPAVFSRLIQTVHQMHKEGFFHGDIKPDNILMTDDGYAKLADFDFLNRLENAKYTSAGTAYYKAADDALYVKGYYITLLQETEKELQDFNNLTKDKDQMQFLIDRRKYLNERIQKRKSINKTYDKDLLLKARDIWSLGATLYDLYFGITQMEFRGHVALQDLKLEDKNLYQHGLVDLIRGLLNPDPQKRVNFFNELCKSQGVPNHVYFTKNDDKVKTFFEQLREIQSKPASYASLPHNEKILWLNNAISRIKEIKETEEIENDKYFINQRNKINVLKRICGSEFVNEYENTNETIKELLDTKFANQTQISNLLAAITDNSQSPQKKLVEYRGCVREKAIQTLSKELAKLNKHALRDKDAEALKSRLEYVDIPKKDYAEKLINESFSKLRINRMQQLRLQVPTAEEWGKMIKGSSVSKQPLDEISGYILQYHTEIKFKNKQARIVYLYRFNNKLTQIKDGYPAPALETLQDRIRQEIEMLESNNFALYVGKNINKANKLIGNSHIPTLDEWRKLSKQTWFFFIEKSQPEDIKKLAGLIENFYDTNNNEIKIATATALVKNCTDWLHEQSIKKLSYSNRFFNKTSNNLYKNAVEQLLARTVSHLVLLSPKQKSEILVKESSDSSNSAQFKG